MKILNFVLVVTCLLLIACESNSEQKKLVEDLKEISSEWGKVSSNLTDLTMILNKTKNNWEKMFSGMTAQKTTKTKLEETTIKQLDSLKNACQGHGATYDQLITQVNDLKIKRDEANAKLQELTQMLQGGKNVASGNQVLEEVKTTMQELRNSIEEIKTSINSTKETCSGTCEAYANLKEPISAEEN